MISVIYFSLEGIHHCFKTRVSFAGTGNCGKKPFVPSDGNFLTSNFGLREEQGSFSLFEVPIESKLGR